MSWVRRPTCERSSAAYSAKSGRAPISASRASTVAEMLKRGLRTSWATPATREPIASRVRARRSCCCMRVKSVTSRKVMTRQGASPSRNHGLARR